MKLTIFSTMPCVFVYGSGRGQCRGCHAHRQP